MRYLVPPVHVQDSLKTPNVKRLEGCDVMTVRCLSLTYIEECRDADCIVNSHLGACEKARFVKTRLYSLPKEADARLTRC